MAFRSWISGLFTRAPVVTEVSVASPKLDKLPPPDLIRTVCDQMWRDYRVPNGKQTVALMTAIGWQESRLTARDQIVTGKPAGQVGPATGFWQFEKGGGVRGVMEHPVSKAIAEKAVAAAGLPWERDAIWRAFTKPEHDRLAATFARLLLLTDPRPLPAAVAGSEDDAWAYYLRNWRPGKPHRGSWGEAWRRGIE